MMAASKGHKDLVDVIINSGYKVNRADKAGKTALFYCLDSNQDDADVFEFLCNQGALLSHQTNKSETIVKYLIDRPVNKPQTLKYLLS